MARFARTETERPDISVAVASFDQQTSSAGGGLILLVQAQGGSRVQLHPGQRRGLHVSIAQAVRGTSLGTAPPRGVDIATTASGGDQ